MRSYQITQTVSDRARGVIRVERVGRGASRHWTTDEFEVALADVLHSKGVHVVRQFLLTDGTTRVFIIDAEGDGFALFEESRRTVTGGEHPVPLRGTTSSTWAHPTSGRKLAGGVAVGPRQLPASQLPPEPQLGVESGLDEAGLSNPATPNLVASECSHHQARDPEA